MRLHVDTYAFIFLEGQSCSRTQYEILLYLNWRKTSFLPTEQLNESWNLIFPRSMQILEGRWSGFSFSHYETKRPAAPYNALDNSMQCSILLFFFIVLHISTSFFKYSPANKGTTTFCSPGYCTWCVWWRNNCIHERMHYGVFVSTCKKKSWGNTCWVQSNFIATKS